MKGCWSGPLGLAPPGSGSNDDPMPIYDNVVDAVGRTPMVKLRRIGGDTHATIIAKLESFNPCGSIKDRVGVAMIRAAERAGTLKPGATIVEATSGNTGIALAFASAALGYKLIITMPENMSRERVALLRSFGTKVILTRGGMMKDAVERAKEIVAGDENAVTLDQFSNPANPAVHRETTAAEILADCEGELDFFVAGVGTGGTISGVGGALKEKLPACQVVAVEPQASAVLSGKPPGPHHIQGIGAGFVPGNLNRELIDEVVAVGDKDAVTMTRRLSAEEGIFAGISSGAALAAAVAVAKRSENADKTIVVVFPDTGERYTSMLGES